MTKTPDVMKIVAGDLMYEVNALYASTEMICSGRFAEPPLDGLLLEACLLHFRVIWDFFYPPNPKKWPTDVVVEDYIPNWKAGSRPANLEKIRKRANTMRAHLTVNRADDQYRKSDTRMGDIEQIRQHTRELFVAFRGALSEEQRKAFVNPLARKFLRYETLRM